MKLNPKSEIRNPKEARNSKSERTRSFRTSGFGFLSDFGFRISDLRGTPGHSRRAFTLIELILAIGVMAIVLVAINGVFFSAMRLRENTLNAVGESLPTQNALSVLRKDLQGAMPPATDGILSGDFRVGNVATLGTGQPVDIEMYTTTGAMHDNEPWSEIQKVTYQLRQPENRQQPGKDLFRSVTRNLLSNTSLQPEDQFMMSGIESIQYSCYDGTAWYDTWDSTVTTNLPSAVRVRILMANPGGIQRPIEMLVPIDSQSRTNQAAQ